MATLKDYQKHMDNVNAQLDKTHLERVKQSLRPHNTPEWFTLGVYLSEWFDHFDFNICCYPDAERLLYDVKARFPQCTYELPAFSGMLQKHYDILQPAGCIAFVLDDIIAPYEHANNFDELDAAKALPAPAYLQAITGQQTALQQANS